MFLIFFVPGTNHSLPTQEDYDIMCSKTVKQGIRGDGSLGKVTAAQASKPKSESPEHT